MNRNQRLMMGLAGGLMMSVVARQVTVSNGKELGLSLAELALLGLAANAVAAPLLADGRGR